MATNAPSHEELLDKLHQRLAENSLAGHWQDRDSPPVMEPWHWPWEAIRSTLIESGDVIGMGSAGSKEARRTVQLINPALTGIKNTSRTLHVSIQLVKPGETAEAHRHTFNAMRFVVESKGMYTTADGEQMIMEPNDLLIQPGMAWHDHTNTTDENAIWLDLLDHPLTRYFDAMAGETYGELPAQPITKPDGYGRKRFATVRPHDAAIGPKAVAYSYKWSETLPILEAAAAEEESDPYDGTILEYVNPRTGGPTLPTIGSWVQMLKPGESTKFHRHTAATAYHSIQGSGVTTVGKTDGKKLEWGERDCWFVPPWQWHKHENNSKSEPAIMFSLTDRPSVEALGFFRTEGS